MAAVGSFHCCSLFSFYFLSFIILCICLFYFFIISIVVTQYYC